MFRSSYIKRFGDRRVELRGEQFSQRLFRLGSRNIQALSLTRSEQKAFYRLLRNGKMTEQKLIEEIQSRCSNHSDGKVLLAIQDTTEINLGSHYNRIDKSSGIGRLDSPFLKDIGFKLHPSLVIDASNCFPIGFSSIRIWNRPLEKTTKQERKSANTPLDQRESQKWLETSAQTKECLNKAKAVVIIQDREGDMYEQFSAQQDNVYMLIRSRINRRLNDGSKLHESLANAPVCGTYVIDITSDSHGKVARKAQMEVRYIHTQIKPPQAKSDQESHWVYVIESKEVNSDVKDPLCWRLITTWPVDCFESAKMIIDWYSCRWIIEEVFRLVKKEGFDLEASELESPWAIRKLSIMLLDTVLKVLQMHIAYQLPEEEAPPVSIAFDPNQQTCLKALNKKAEGKTVALQNPYQSTNLKWAVWVIARIGGWKGYQSQRPPGMTTLLNGMKQFDKIYEGWELNIDVGTR